jgi:ligand-binding sensor domain-containing protein
MQHLGRHRCCPREEERTFFSPSRFCGARFTALFLFFGLGVVSQLRADQQAAASRAVPVVRLRVETVKVRLIEGRDMSFGRLPNTVGLSQTRVENIAQDHDGFMWFGTQSGLNRFDGYKCKVFKHDPERPGSLSGVFIDSLFEDRSGALWVGSDQYLDRFDPATETFSRLHLASADPKRSIKFRFISQDAAGVLWLPTDNGLYGLNPASGG